MRPFRRRGLLVAAVSGLLTAAALVAAVLLLAGDRLPWLLTAAAAHLVPGYRVALGDARLHGLERLDLRRIRVRARASGALVFAAKHVRVGFTPWDLRRGRLGTVRITAPLVLVPDALAGSGSAGDAGAPPAWSVERLVVTHGRVHARRLPARPGVAFRFATDLRALDLSGDGAERTHRLRVRDLRVTLADGPPNLVLENAVVGVRPAALARGVVDEVRLFGLAATLPAPAATGAGATGGDASVPAFGWRVGRLVTRNAHVAVPAAATQPGAAFTFGLDLHDVALDAPLNERLHRVRLHDLRLHLPDRPPSLVVDAAQVEFTLADLLARQRIARVAVDGGTLVVDGAFRGLLAGDGGTGSSSVSEASLGTLEVRGLVLRIAGLGDEIPDITLTFATTLREVPLSPAALTLARDPQRIELADLRLYSPLDPFRQVVRVGSVFVDFTLADVVQQRITALTILSPTIYLGEDLIWYMNAARRQSAGAAAAAGPPPPAWTVGLVRADLGSIVVTFNGSDRLSLPITFQSQARNVALDDLAALRFSVGLEVPKQSYTFPGFDLELVDMEGKLHFDYPRGEAHDNVVNVLEVGEMRWRDYRLAKGWLSMTFDERGINGKLGGAAYQGYVDGGISIPFGAGPPWSGWIAGTQLDLAPIAAVLAGSAVEMSGVADVRGAVDLRNGVALERAEGQLTLARPGRLGVTSLDTVLERLPADASPLQRDLARIVVEALRDYPYTGGEGSLAFADARGVARLSLESARGARRFELHYYQDEARVAEVTP